MNTPDSTAMHSSPKKRSHDGQIISTSPQTPATSNDEHLASELDRTNREQSPALSTTGSSLTELTPSLGQAPSLSTPSAAKPKKQKLTFAEREVQKALQREEKEAKEKQRADEKARREEEKQRRDEERRKKEEEKEVARRAREIEKAERQKAKDAEKQQKEVKKAKEEEEKLKREKSQLKIGLFFGRPAPASTPPSSPDNMSSGAPSRRSSIAELDMEPPVLEAKPTPLKGTDYEKMFPSFFVFENTEIAPVNRFLLSRQLNNPVSLPLAEFPDIGVEEDLPTVGMHFEGHKRKKRRIMAPVREILDRLHGTSDTPIDLTNEDPHSTIEIMLEEIPVKILAFKEDVRPPYQGTYTRKISPRAAARIPRNPFHRGLPDTNYDYDSEAEWEPPADGDDDVNMDDDDSESEADEEEMDDFLDDEEDVGRRRMVVGDMQPVCSGICWEGEMSAPTTSEMREYRIDVIDDAHSFPIDPHSTTYWAKPAKATPPKPEINTEGAASLMQPPRLPLSSVNAPNALLHHGFVLAAKSDPEAAGTENVTSVTKQKGRATDAGKPLKMISSDLLPAFKQAIAGSELTKAGLVEVLKKQFPKVSKDTIKDSLSVVASREGVKEADKRWVINA